MGPRERVPQKVRIKDTADFFALIMTTWSSWTACPSLCGTTRGGPVRAQDEPKFWVKRSINLVTGGVKVLKWVFWERFSARIGDLVLSAYGTPEGSADPRTGARRPDFMQGETVPDSTGNPLRILDYIRGKTLGEAILTLGADHQNSFTAIIPPCSMSSSAWWRAIRFLHESGEKHGDIRRDHLIKDSATGRYRWIDFDFNYRHGASRFAYDLFGLGNILIYITGRGDVPPTGSSGTTLMCSTVFPKTT